MIGTPSAQAVTVGMLALVLLLIVAGPAVVVTALVTVVTWLALCVPAGTVVGVAMWLTGIGRAKRKGISA